MSRSATAWKRDEDEASAMISKDHFDSTIGFIRSDVADVKADVREMRSRVQAQDDKNAAFEKELSGKFDAFRQDINSKFDAFRQEINSKFDAFRQEIHGKLDALPDKFEERFASSEKKTEERFKQTDDRLARLETDFAKMLGWQKAIALFLALLITMMGGMFIAMAKGFHWF